MSKLFWTKWFFADWENEPGLRASSLAAQGLWMRMLCIAAKHDPIGYVAIAGKGLELPALARIVGASESEVASLVGELDRNGVFSRDRAGRIYNRRMVRHARSAAAARKNGKLGGNPTLRKDTPKSAGVNPPPNPNSSCVAVSPPSVEKASQAQGPPAREGMIVPAAFDLADKLTAAMGCDRDDPRCVGTPYVAQKWLNAGWNADLCVATVTRVAAGRSIDTLKYFEKAIARAHAEFASPVPTVAPAPQEVTYAQAGQHQPGGAYGAALDNGRAAHASLRKYIAERKAAETAGGGGGGQVVELVPSARRSG